MEKKQELYILDKSKQNIIFLNKHQSIFKNFMEKLVQLAETDIKLTNSIKSIIPIINKLKITPEDRIENELNKKMKELYVIYPTVIPESVVVKDIAENIKNDIPNISKDAETSSTMIMNNIRQLKLFIDRCFTSVGIPKNEYLVNTNKFTLINEVVFKTFLNYIDKNNITLDREFDKSIKDFPLNYENFFIECKKVQSSFIGDSLETRTDIFLLKENRNRIRLMLCMIYKLIKIDIFEVPGYVKKSILRYFPKHTEYKDMNCWETSEDGTITLIDCIERNDIPKMNIIYNPYFSPISSYTPPVKKQSTWDKVQKLFKSSESKRIKKQKRRKSLYR